MAQQEDVFYSGIELGRLMEKLDGGEPCIQMKIRMESKQRIYDTCVALGYIPRFTEEPYNWLRLEAIKMALEN